MSTTYLGKMSKQKHFDLWRQNRRIRGFQPSKCTGKVILVGMGPKGLKSRGKVNPRLFFPTFCRVLGLSGIASAFAVDRVSLVREIGSSGGLPIILVNLAHELYDDLELYEISEDMMGKSPIIFNSRQAAEIIMDKKRANEELSKYGILMPSLSIERGDKVFSNARFGTKERVHLQDAAEELDNERYNTKFIDTKLEYNGKYYFTCARLMCIGPHIVQAYARASPAEEGNLSVRDVTTPRDSELINFIYKEQIERRWDEHSILAQKIAEALGPGFYAHDVLVDTNSENLLLSEAGFKFYQPTYFERFDGLTIGNRFHSILMDQGSYAAYAACVFVTYCTEMEYF